MESKEGKKRKEKKAYYRVRERKEKEPLMKSWSERERIKEHCQSTMKRVFLSDEVMMKSPDTILKINRRFKSRTDHLWGGR